MKPLNPLRSLFILLMGTFSFAAAQTVQFTINLPNYDVIYLSDFVDIHNLKLSSNIPDLSVEMRSSSPTPIMVWMSFEADIQLRGDSRQLLAKGHTNDFELAGVRRVSSKDFSGAGAQGIRFSTDDKATQALQDKLMDYVQRFPTAPVGQYFFEVKVYAAPYPSQAGYLGGLQKIINVRNASESEVNITLVSPEQGASTPSPFPTFSWSSEEPKVTLYVYEKLPIYHSPEEAVTGIPFLKRDLSGVSTFTYPADASRRLEFGHTYYWFVETKVLSTRGNLTKRSEIRMFRVLEGGGNTNSNPILLALNAMGGDLAAQLAGLLQNGWVPSGATIDGTPATPSDVNALIQRLVTENIEVQIAIE
jgi:hypothetical protein